MRPILLEIEGFASFRDRTELDFSELDLFAITGPTGAGKSSLVDSITYALYGRVPRVGKGVKDCIAQGLERMGVSFTFSVDELRYRVHRQTPVKGQAKIQLEEEIDGEWTPVADRAREATAYIENLIGLDYDAFTRSVILPQGHFDEFLAGDPSERRKILVDLLGLQIYRRVHARAGQIQRDARHQVESIDRRIAEDYADATRDVLKDRKRELTGLTKVLAALDKEATVLASAAKLAEQLRAARERIDDLGLEVDEAQTELDDAEKILATGKDGVAALEKQVAHSKRAIAKITYDEKLLVKLVAARTLITDVEDLEASIARGEAEAADAIAKIKDAQKGLSNQQIATTNARETLEAVEDSFNELRRAHAADELRASLRRGDPCPVCGNQVESTAKGKHASLDGASKKLTSARGALEKEEGKLATLDTDLAVLNERLEQTRLRVVSENDSLGTKVSQVKKDLGVSRRPSAATIKKRVEDQETARNELEGLESKLETQQADLDERKARLADAREKQAGLKERTEGSKKSQREEEARAKKLAETLAGEAKRNKWDDVTAVVDKDPLAALQNQHDETREQLRTGQGRRGELQNIIARLEGDIAKRKELEKELNEKKDEEDVAGDLATLLRADRFLDFVLEEALNVLAADGSRHLEELSEGRYQFKIEGQEFYAVDRWNADEARPAKTLSGGETFVASLALALALAERLPELSAGVGSGKLECLILDEGFGTLDDETLEAVARALEALRSSNRMVCAITHVKELADRMPARIEVAKSESGAALNVVS